MRKLLNGILLLYLMFIVSAPAYAEIATKFETNKNVDISSYDKFRTATYGKAYDMDGYYGAQCWDGVDLLYERVGMYLSTGGQVYAKYCWLNTSARTANTGSKFTQITDKTKIKRGDVVVLNQVSDQYPTGHIAFADEDYDTSGYIQLYGQNQSTPNDNHGCPFNVQAYRTSLILGAFRYNGWVQEERGQKMTSGYVRVLPDGDYMIANAGDPSYFLDIQGTTVPAANGTNVQLYKTTTGDLSDSDVWTIKYSNGFYTISQYGQSVCLSVTSNDTLRGKNVQVRTNDSGTGQKWAISKNGKNGYRLEAQCSGYSLDVNGGTLANNTNIIQYSDNATNAQSWVFIPYKPSQTFPAGRYVLLYALDPSFELDVSGDTGNVADGTKVQIWADTAPSRYNSFDVVKLTNGYYKLVHAASGKLLTVNGGSTAYKTTVVISSDNGSNAQQWAIISDGTGYSLISKANGYSLDLPDGLTENQNNIQVYPRTGSDYQRWTFVQAEHTVRFDANGGTNAPADAVKYYKTGLTLPDAIPERQGYHFLGWSAFSDSAGPSLLPGDTYTSDADTTLYAVWEPLEYTLSFDMNGGEGHLESIHIDDGSPCSIPDYTPVKTGYDFLGWNTDKNASEAAYRAGDLYYGGDAALYAIWKIRTYIISFDSQGAGSYDSITAEHGTSITLPVPEKQGVLFGGWYTAEGVLVNDQTVITSDLSLTARWSEPSRLILPEGLSVIEDEAFAGTAPNVIIIPEGVTSLGSRAFADNSSLYSVVVYSRQLAAAPDAFANCPHLTIYGYTDSQIQYYCLAKGIPFRAIDDGSYISSDELPVGATVTGEKWTYTESRTEILESPETSLDGWTNTGEYTWVESGTGTYKYASYPSGFDTSSSLYKKYNKSKLVSSSTDTTKREVSDPSFLTYIYWHWTFVDSVSADHASGGHNVFIRAARQLNVNVSGSVYRDFTYFDAFETTENQGTVGPRNASETYDIGTEGGYYFWRNVNGDASQWWWRFNVYQQAYTDYQKYYVHSRTVTEDKESAAPVTEGGDISNVQHLVTYTF